MAHLQVGEAVLPVQQGVDQLRIARQVVGQHPIDHLWQRHGPQHAGLKLQLMYLSSELSTFGSTEQMVSAQQNHLKRELQEVDMHIDLRLPAVPPRPWL